MTSPTKLREGASAFYFVDACYGSGMELELNNQVAITDRRYVHRALGFNKDTREAYISTILPRRLRITGTRALFGNAYEEQFQTGKSLPALTSVVGADLRTVNVFRSQVSITPYEADAQQVLESVPRLLNGNLKRMRTGKVLTLLMTIANRAGEAVLAGYDEKVFVPVRENGSYSVKEAQPGAGMKWIRRTTRPDHLLWVAQEQLRRVLAGEQPLSRELLEQLCEELP